MNHYYDFFDIKETQLNYFLKSFQEKDNILSNFLKDILKETSLDYESKLKFAILVYMYQNECSDGQKNYIENTIFNNTKLSGETAYLKFYNICNVFVDEYVIQKPNILFKNEVKLLNSQFFENIVVNKLCEYSSDDFEENKNKLRFQAFLSICLAIGVNIIPTPLNPILLVMKMSGCVLSGLFAGRMISCALPKAGEYVSSLNEYKVNQNKKEFIGLTKKFTTAMKIHFDFITLVNNRKNKKEQKSYVSNDERNSNYNNINNEVASFIESFFYNSEFKKVEVKKKIVM